MLVKPMHTSDLLRQLEALLVTHEDEKRKSDVSGSSPAPAKSARKVPSKPAHKAPTKTAPRKPAAKSVPAAKSAKKTPARKLARAR